MHTFELISNELCPYTQRAAIQLAEKGVAYTRTYIDLAHKPAWFAELSPLGKVPVLRAGLTAIFESHVICEYLEEVAPGRHLHPADPLERAQHRGWIEFCSAMTADVFAFYTAPDRTTFERKRDDLHAKARRLEGSLDAQPFFGGAEFQLVDAAFAPIFRLFDSFDQIGDFGVFAGMHRARAYRRALAERDSVRQVVVPDYHERFMRYLAARGSYLSGLMEQQTASV